MPISSFGDVDAALAKILTDNTRLLVAGLNNPVIQIKQCIPYPEACDQTFFIYRGPTQAVEPSFISMPGAGAGNVHTHTDGISNWRITIAVRYPGSEETASQQLGVLSFNLYNVLLGYTIDQVWVGMTPHHSSVVVMPTPDHPVWALMEEWSLNVTWEAVQ
jgi:hypothetical protein